MRETYFLRVVLVAKKDIFLNLLLRHNKKLFCYIVSLVPNYAEAEDILQETASILWDKFDDFQQGTNFYGWAKQVARYKISHYYRQKKDILRFDKDVLENIVVANETLDKSSDKQIAALRGCLIKLDSRGVSLLKSRYQQGVSVREIAEKTDLSVSILYKRLARIYAMLRKCISQTLLIWETGE